MLFLKESNLPGVSNRGAFHDSNIYEGIRIAERRTKGRARQLAIYVPGMLQVSENNEQTVEAVLR
jgi:hypothetical protein